LIFFFEFLQFLLTCSGSVSREVFKVEDHQLKRKKRERQATQLKARDGYSLVAGGRGRSRFLCGMLHPIHLLLERLVLMGKGHFYRE